MASCVYKPTIGGKELLGFKEQRNILGYSTAKNLLNIILDDNFQKKYAKYIEYDDQHYPTYESIIKIPYIKNFLMTHNLIDVEQKKYPYVDNTKENFDRLVNQAHIFNSTSVVNDKLTAVVEKDDSSNQIRVVIKQKSKENDNKAKNQFGVMTLNTKLAFMFNSLGVTVGMLEDNETDKNGQVDFSKASNIADGFAGLIKIANGMEGVNALPEEFAHLIIGVFHDNPLVSRSLNILAGNQEVVKEILGDEYENNYNYYSKNPNYDKDGKILTVEQSLAEEALGRVLQDKLLQKNERDISNSLSLNSLVNRLINFFKNIFKKFNINEVIKAKQEVSEQMNSLANDFLNGKTITKQDMANSARNARFNQLQEDVDNVLQLVQNGLETERKRLKITAAGDKSIKTEITRRILTLNAFVNDRYKLKGLVTYAKYALDDLKTANEQLDKVNTMTGSVKFKLLMNVKTILDSYTDFVKDFKKTLNQYEDAHVVNIDGTDVDLDELWSKINNEFASSQSVYEDAVSPAFISFLAPFYEEAPIKDKEGNIIPLKRLFRTAGQEDIDNGFILNEDTDISQGDKFVISASNSHSMLIQLYDNVVKASKNKAKEDTIKNIREIWALRKKAENRGIKTFEWMFEKDNEGHKTGNYISEYNYGQFEKDYKELIKNLEAKYGKNPFGDDYKEFCIERKAWLDSHAFSIFGKPVPNDSYKNKEYERLSKDQLDTLNEFLEYKASKENDLPKSKISKVKAIQRRKTFGQRMTDSMTSPISIFNNIKEDFKQAFTATDDDDQIYGNVDKGLTDFTDKEFMTLPLLYTNRLKNPDELSTDVYADLAAYTYMTNTYREMDKITDALTIGREAVKQKKLLKTNGGKVMEEQRNIDGKITKKPIYVNDTDNKLIQRLDDFLESQVYGRYIKDEGNVAGLDVAKTVSVFQKWTSLAYLGVNWLAGAANVGTAIGMQNIEAAAGQYFSAKSLLSADKEYASLLPAFMGEIASRQKQSKLALFDELFDVKQDYGDKIKRTQKKNLLQRIFGSNIMFIQQGAGDHWIYNRTAIAMAKNTKVKVNGKETNVWDALEVVDYKDTGYKIMQVKEGTTNLDGTKFDAKKFKLKIAHVNQSIAGIYNDEDQNAANRIAVGRVLQQMRKWVIPQMMYRFQKGRNNMSIGGNEEGYYRTFGRYLVQNLRHGQFAIVANWNNLNDEEKANCKKAIFELCQLASLWILSQAFNLGKDRDKSPWALKYAEYMMHREIHELGFLTPSPLMVSEGIKTIQSPAVILSGAASVAKLINTATRGDNWTNEIESGNYEGHNNVYKAFMQCPFPGIAQYKQFTKMFDDIDNGTKYYMKDYK